MKASASILAACLMLAACSAESREKMEAEKFESMNLTPQQQEVAEALIEGYKMEMNMPILRSREYGQAACYARKISIPNRHRKAFISYLKVYPDADDDFYGFFSKHGVSDQSAYRLWEASDKAFEACKVGNLIKERMNRD